MSVELTTRETNCLTASELEHEAVHCLESLVALIDADISTQVTREGATVEWARTILAAMHYRHLV